jgi:hypothetical protein
MDLYDYSVPYLFMSYAVGLDLSAGRSTPSTVKETKDEKENEFEELEHVDEYTNHDFVERAFIVSRIFQLSHDQCVN